MNTDFPIPITNDSDLDYYESYLNKEFTVTQEHTSQLSRLLKEYIGLPLRVDFVNDNRTGVLNRVGDDYFVIKLANRRENIIPLNSVKLLTVLQNNIKPPHF